MIVMIIFCYNVTNQGIFPSLNSGYDDINLSENIYELCLEQTHINMAISKIGGMLRTGKIKKIIFATVDRSPHCVQMHYIGQELQKMMNLENVIIENYVVVDDELIKIESEIISLSKNLNALNKKGY
jgi:hypothetical protein